MDDYDEAPPTPIEQIWDCLRTGLCILGAFFLIALIAGAAGYHYHRYQTTLTTTTTETAMPDQIIRIAKIQDEAKQAAHIYSDINAACPYPFGTSAAVIFKTAFLAERANINQARANTAEAATKGVAP